MEEVQSSLQRGVYTVHVFHAEESAESLKLFSNCVAGYLRQDSISNMAKRKNGRLLDGLIISMARLDG